MRLADVENSRAVLIGASSYHELDDLPAVAQNLIDLKRLLMDPTVWGLPESHCVVLSDQDSVDVILDAVHDAAASATDTLLVYYAGHGLLDQSMNLLLALPSSDARKMYKSVRYDAIRQELRDAVHCPSKVVILDCCFSGRAVRGKMGRTADIADQAAVEGTWLVTASAEHAPAVSPPGEPHTAFTGELISLLDLGIKDGPEYLDVDTLYLKMHQRLKAKDRPEPQQRIGKFGAQIVIARNRWHAGSGDLRPAPRQTLFAVPARLGGLPTSLDDLTRMIDELRGSGADGQADGYLQAVGRHRETQEVASTLARLGQLTRAGDVDAILDGLALRGARDCADVLDVLTQVGATPLIDAVLAREAVASAERVAELAELLAGSESLGARLDQLLDTVIVAAVDQPDRVIDVFSSLLLRKLPDEADRLVDLCRVRAGDVEIATIADGLREVGRDAAAFRLYPAALPILAARLPDQVATLTAGLRRHGDIESARTLAVRAATRCGTAADRADLLISFGADKALEEEIAWITEIFARVQDDSTLHELADALRVRGVNTVALYLAVLARQPIARVLQHVNELVRNGRPLDAFAILEQAGAARPAKELEKLTAGLDDTPGFSRLQRIFATVVARTDCTVELYRLLHRRKDIRFQVLQAELIKQRPAVLFGVVVELVRSVDPDLGGVLLTSAARDSDYIVSDELVRYADEQTAEILVLAAVGLLDLKRIVHALRQRGFRLEYRTPYAAKLLLRRPKRTIVVVISALCTADVGAPATGAARRLAALPPHAVAYLLDLLMWQEDRPGRPGGTSMAGPESAAVTARAIFGSTVAYTPDRATKFVTELRDRQLTEVAEKFVDLWAGEHPTGVDPFIFAGELFRQREAQLSHQVLRRRAHLPQEHLGNPVASAVAEVFHHVRIVCKAIDRYPVPQSIVQRLRSTGTLAEGDCCLLVVGFPARWLAREVVFTDTFVRHWSGSRFTYTEIAAADKIINHGRKVWLAKDGVVSSIQWSMRSEDEAHALSMVLNRVRNRVRGVRARYLQLKIEAPRIGVKGRAHLP
ncbi:caspase family protein [Micromonosporaceae bacterium Da 78-11]